MLIGIEDIEFGFVGIERRAGIFARGVVAAVARHSRQFAGRADLKAFDHFFQTVFIGSKILHDLHRPGARIQDRHHIGRLHLFANELQRGFLDAVLFGNLHGAEVEQHRHQTAVLIANDGRRSRGGGADRDPLRCGRRRSRSLCDGLAGRHGRQRSIPFQLLKFKDRNRLRLAVFKKREVALSSDPEALSPPCREP